MHHRKVIKHTTKSLLTFFVVSVVIFSIVIAYIGIRGNQVFPSQTPTQTYQDISFITQARDKLQLRGWFFPADSEKVVVIAHGWGGNRARLVDLAELLQRSGYNVLTFDFRAGTGENTFGVREAKDLAAAIDWVMTTHHVEAQDITILGASMGAVAAVDYVSTHPVGKLVLVSPVVDVNQVKYAALRNAHLIFPELYATVATAVERVFYGIKPINPVQIFDKVTIPTFVIHAEDDDLSLVKTVYRLQDQVEGRKQTNVQFEYVPAGGHNFLDLDKANGYVYGKEILAFIGK